MIKRILVTGGAGFIGSHFVDLLVHAGKDVTVLDSLTYAGTLDHLTTSCNRINFIQGDIRDSMCVRKIFAADEFDAVVNLAAESHVDRSIRDPYEFYSTNVAGTVVLLSALKEHESNRGISGTVRFLQMSTDEVFGALGATGLFNEDSRYAPNSPYAASKAAADHFVRSFGKTFGLDTVVVHGSNNFGSRQHSEKLIPMVIARAVAGEKIPVYGTGENIRSWIAVEDQCSGLKLALELGRAGENYCIGGAPGVSEITNNEMVRIICEFLDEMRPKASGSYSDQVIFVDERPGHDFRYAMSIDKAVQQLGFLPSLSLRESLRRTICSYL